MAKWFEAELQNLLCVHIEHNDELSRKNVFVLVKQDGKTFINIQKKAMLLQEVFIDKNL